MKIKSLTLLTFILLACFSCQKDDNINNDEISEEGKPNITIKKISKKEIPEILKLIEPKYDASKKFHKIFIPFGEIETENITKLEDSLGNTNYSFILFPKKPKPNSFFNLSISKENGNIKKAIVEYRMTPEFAEAYYKGSKSFSEFRGNILSFPFSGTLEKDICIQNIDEIVNCSLIEVDGNGNTTSNGGGGVTVIGGTEVYYGDTTVGGGASGGGSQPYVIRRCNASGNHSTAESCSNPGLGFTWTIILRSHNKNSNKATNCCSGTTPTTPIATNPIAPVIDYIDNCVPIPSIGAFSFISNTALVFPFKSYIENKGCTPTTKSNIQALLEFGADHRSTPEEREYANRVIAEIINALNEGKTVDIEELITNDLTGKEKCIADHLMKLDNSYVKDLLGNFEGESEFSITLKSVHTLLGGADNKPINGNTQVNSKGIITININSSLASGRAALGVARTILHEILHAEMYRLLGTEGNTQEILDFRDTFNSYKDTTFEPTPQHNSMAKLYIDLMTNALKDFHKNVMIGDYNYLTDNGVNPLPNAFYKGLAWSGLKNHNVQAWLDLTAEEQEEINDVFETYIHSTTKTCPTD